MACDTDTDDYGGGYSELSRWKENALSQGRKISLSGMPMPDVAQHQEGESDYKAENTYVDALSLDIRHDVTDIHVPVGSGHFALEVRRSLTQEIWNEDSLPFENQLDKPFGPCWSSAICPSVHVIEDSGETKYLVTDHNGQSYTFHELEYMDEDDVVVGSISKIEASSTQSALSLKDVQFGRIDGEVEWVLYLANGTKCYYNDTAVTNSVYSGKDGDIEHTFHRISDVTDRAGNTLSYTYAEPEHDGSIIPSEIEASSGQKLEITLSNNLVAAVTDPRGHTIDYEYNNEGHLDKVCRQDGGETTYTYADSEEQDTRYGDSGENSAFEDELNTYHLTIESVEDANGNTYEFTFMNAPRYNNFVINGAGYSIAQLMNPQILQQVVRPDDSYVSFEEFDAAYPPGLSNNAHRIVVTNPMQDEWTYQFADAKKSDIELEESDIELYEYTRLEISGPLGATESYWFDSVSETRTENGLLPIVMVSNCNFSGQTTTFAYDYADSLEYFKPSSQTNALGGTKHFSYTGGFGNQLKSTINELNQITVYGFDDYGNRTSVTNFPSGGGDPLAITLMEYGNPDYTTFTNFMTLQTVVDLNNPASNLVTRFASDEFGKVATQTTYPAGTGNPGLTTTYDYDANNNLIYVQDPNGNVTTNGYDQLNRLVEIAFFDGETTLKCTKRFWYDLRSNKIWEKDENGSLTLFRYNEQNQVVKTIRNMNEAFTEDDVDNVVSQGAIVVEESTDIVTTSEYNIDGTLHATVDPRGLRTEFGYDALRRLTSTVVGVSYADSPLPAPDSPLTTTFDYSGANPGAITLPPYKFSPTKVTDPRNYVTEMVYDDLNRTIESRANITLTEGEEVAKSQMGYDALGNLRFATNWLDGVVGNCQVTETRYDHLNRPIKVTSALGTADEAEVGISYTSTGLKWQTTNELDRVSTVQYNLAGRPVKTISPEIETDVYAITETGYDANGNVWWVQDANENTTTNVYDYRNRVLEIRAPAVPDWGSGGTGALTHPTVSMVYDNVGNVLSVTDAEENTTTNFYDAANRMYKTWAPEVSVYGVVGDMRPVTTNGFDHGGNIILTMDANEKTVEMQYDAFGRLTNTVDAINNTIGFEYDENGNQTFLVDGNGNRTQFTYDGLNRKTSTLYPSVGGTSAHEDAEYDLVGNRIGRTDCNGVETTYAYDSRNRLKTVSYLPSSRTRIYVYDDASNLLSVDEFGTTDGDVAYTYDALNRVTNETSVGVTHIYKYDLNGNRTNALYGVTGREVEWEYDALNRIKEINEGSNQTLYFYDLNSNPLWRKYPSNIWESRTFDAMGRLLTMRTDNYTTGWHFKMAYDYDAVGSAREMIQDSWNLVDQATNTVTTWEYDDRYRLLNETVVVDDASSLVNRSTDYTWDSADNRLTRTNHVAGSWVSTTTYTPNVLNQMTGWTDGTTNVVYGFDANGNRTNDVRTVGGSTVLEKAYRYDEDNRLLHATVGSITNEFAYDYRTRRYYRATSTETNLCVFDGGLAVQEYDASDPNNQAPATDNLQVEYLRGEGMGGGVGGMVYSIRKNASDEDEIKCSHANHRGDIIARTDHTGSLTSFALYEAYGTRPYEWGSDPDRQKANTKDEEAELGLLQEGMRLRDLETGVWLSGDPIGFADGPNRYCYVHCNPITKFDPFGLKIKSVTPRYSGPAHLSDKKYSQGSGFKEFFTIAKGSLGGRARMNKKGERVSVIERSMSYGRTRLESRKLKQGIVAGFKFEYKIERTGHKPVSRSDYNYGNWKPEFAEKLNYSFKQRVTAKGSGLYYRKKGTSDWIVHPDSAGLPSRGSRADGPDFQSDVYYKEKEGSDVVSYAGDMFRWAPQNTSSDEEYMMQATWEYRAQDRDNAVEGAHQLTVIFNGDGDVLESSSKEITKPHAVDR